MTATQAPHSVSTETTEIVNALDVLLSASVQGDRTAKAYGPMSAADLMRLFDGKSPAHIAAMGIIKNPVGRASRDAIKVLGERLNEIGGVRAMTDALYSAADHGPQGQRARRIAIMDNAWHGVGEWLS